jgi:hypothetical protein
VLTAVFDHKLVIHQYSCALKIREVIMYEGHIQVEVGVCHVTYVSYKRREFVADENHEACMA